MRDALQRYQHLQRVVMDLDMLLDAKANPPPQDDPDRVVAFQTPLSADQLRVRRADAAAALAIAKHSFDGMIQQVNVTVSREEAAMLPWEFLPQCLTAWLNPSLYPEAGEHAPAISFLLQFFNRPHHIPLLLNPVLECARKDGLKIEFLVNVDSPEDAGVWGEWAKRSGGVVVPVISNNVHEIRGYNRLARMATGKVLMLLQDDDVPPSDCAWLHTTLRAFEAWPRLGALGSRHFFFDWSPNALNNERIGLWDMYFHDDAHGLPFQFVVVTNTGPITYRREAWDAIGGLDHGFSDPGMCGICTDYDATSRLWFAGWQVGYTTVPAWEHKTDEGNSHRSAEFGRCWIRQWRLCTEVMFQRFGKPVWEPDSDIFFGSAVHTLLTEHVRQLNLRLLRRIDPNGTCPFSAGCKVNDTATTARAGGRLAA